jgi:hypothetical protein
VQFGWPEPTAITSVLIARTVLISLLAAAAAAARLPAQRAASAFLPANHWGRSAVVRLVALQALPADAAAGAWPASYRELEAWLTSAEQTALNQSDTLAAAIAAGFMERLQLEFDLVHERTFRARAGVGYLAESGVLRAGSMQRVEGVGWRYPGPRSLESERTWLIDAQGSVQMHPSFIVSAEASHQDQADVWAAYVAAKYRAIDAWVGRRSMSVGSAAQNGIVLNAAQLDGGGFSLRDGVRAGFLGRLRLDAALARTQRSGAVRHPYFHAARISLTPARSLTVGFNRALLFGGEGNQSITAKRVVLALIGFTDTEAKDSDFENQVASIDALWRVGRDVLMYGEFGADDSGFAFLHVPGVIVGAQLGRVPRFEELQIGAELVHFQKSCCSYPPWYQHGALGDGWTDRGRLWGHPLGGNGTEAALMWRVDSPRHVAMVEGRVFVRQRGEENLFSPTREGRSYGVSVNVGVAVRRIVLSLRAAGEQGNRDWRAGQIQVRAELRP